MMKIEGGMNPRIRIRIHTKMSWLRSTAYLPTSPISSQPSESIATLPPFGPIEGHKWFVQISSQ